MLFISTCDNMYYISDISKKMTFDEPVEKPEESIVTRIWTFIVRHRKMLLLLAYSIMNIILTVTANIIIFLY